MNEYKYNPINMTPFKWFVLENFPFIEEDFDSLTSYGLWCKLKNYFDNIATKVNEMGTQVEQFTEAFIVLKDYVDNYFENLDVQDEINNKLDKMASDGTLTNLISGYVDPFIDSQNRRITTIENKVNSAVSSTPIAVTSVQEMTDTTKIYVNTTNGHWYSYDGTSWQDNGVYQSTGIANSSIYLPFLNNSILGSEFSIITEAGESYPRATFMLATSYNISKWKIKFQIKKEYITPNSNIVIRLLRGVTPSGGQASYVERSLHLNSSSVGNEYQTFEYELEEETPLNNINGFAIRINNNSGSLVTNWNLKDIQFWADDTLTNPFLVTTETFTPYVSEITEPISYIASKKYVERIIENFNQKFNQKLEELNSVISYDSMKKSNLYNVTCWGDSITQGGSPGKPYPADLQELLGENVNVTNRGVGGQCSGMIAFRQGGNIVTSASDFIIPASNQESVTFNYEISSGYLQNFSNVHIATCTILGIEGTISLANSGIATFTRTETGSQVEVPQGTQVVSTQAVHDEDLVLIMCGVNDVAFARSYINGVVQNIQAMINHLTPPIKRFLVISTTTTTGQTSGTAGHNAVTNINNQLRNLFPNNFVDLENYLVNQCIYDMGLTPTAEDLEKMSQGTIPPQLMYDSTHPNAETRVYIARFIYNEMLSRGWVIK